MKRNSEEPKANVFIAICSAILLFILFYICWFLCFLGIGLVFYGILKVDVLRFLANVFFLKDATADHYAMVLSIMASCSMVLPLAEKMHKNPETHRLSSKILGISLIVINSIFLVLNIFGGGGAAITSNIGLIIAGVAFLKIVD